MLERLTSCSFLFLFDTNIIISTITNIPENQKKKLFCKQQLYSLYLQSSHNSFARSMGTKLVSHRCENVIFFNAWDEIAEPNHAIEF